MGDVESSLLDLLGNAQKIGLVGAGPVTTHLQHARGFAAVLGGCPEGTLLDLGSGAGLPGLVLAAGWPESRWVLLDSRARSTEFLTRAVERLGMHHRVTVVAGRAEVVAHDPAFRGTMSVVTARSVAPPAVVAECAAGFLMEGGTLVVSEPPEPGLPRWDAAGLARLGMGPARLVSVSGQVHFSLVNQHSPCPERYPRRTGVPARRRLF